MRHIPHGRVARHTLPYALRDHSFTLFDWANQRNPTLTPGGTFLYHHKRVRPVLANLIAELSGIGPQGAA